MTRDRASRSKYVICKNFLTDVWNGQRVSIMHRNLKRRLQRFSKPLRVYDDGDISHTIIPRNKVNDCSSAGSTRSHYIIAECTIVLLQLANYFPGVAQLFPRCRQSEKDNRMRPILKSLAVLMGLPCRSNRCMVQPPN